MKLHITSSLFFIACWLHFGALSAQTIKFRTLKEIGTPISITLSYEGEIILKGVQGELPESGTAQEYSLLDQEVVIQGNVTMLRVSNADITSLSLVNCEGLTELDCSQNKLETLDLSEAPALKKLVCFANSLTSLNLTSCSHLEVLKCTNNKLSVVDVNSLRQLEELSCSNNILSKLDVSSLTKLKTLKCYKNQLKSLSLTQSPHLEKLWCSENAIESLDLSHNHDLKAIWCYNNNLESIKLGDLPQLLWFYCDNNRLQSLDCSKMPKLNKLTIYSNRIKDSEMTSLISSLPVRGGEQASLIVIDTKNSQEGNHCTVDNVEKASSMGWSVLDYYGGANSHQGVEYNGHTGSQQLSAPSSRIEFRKNGNHIEVSNLDEGAIVSILDASGRTLYEASCSSSDLSFCIECPLSQDSPLFLLVDGNFIAKLLW